MSSFIDISLLARQDGIVTWIQDSEFFDSPDKGRLRGVCPDFFETNPPTPLIRGAIPNPRSPNILFIVSCGIVVPAFILMKS